MQRTIFALLLAGGLAVFGLRAARPTIAHEAVQVAWPTIFLTMFAYFPVYLSTRLSYNSRYERPHLPRLRRDHAR